MTTKTTVPTVPAAFRDHVVTFRAAVARAAVGSDVGEVYVRGEGEMIPYRKRDPRQGWFTHEVTLEVAVLDPGDCPEAFTLDGDTWRAFGPYALRPVAAVPEGATGSDALEILGGMTRTWARTTFDHKELPRELEIEGKERLQGRGQDGRHRTVDDGAADAAMLAERIGAAVVRVGDRYYRVDVPPEIRVGESLGGRRKVYVTKQGEIGKKGYFRAEAPVPLAALSCPAFVRVLDPDADGPRLQGRSYRPAMAWEEASRRRGGVSEVAVWKDVPMADVLTVHDADAVRGLTPRTPPPARNPGGDPIRFAPANLEKAHVETIESWAAFRRETDADPDAVPAALARFVDAAHPEDVADLGRATWSLMLEDAADGIWPDPVHDPTPALDALDMVP